MAFTVKQLTDLLDVIFPGAYSARNALFLLGSVTALLPLLRLHVNQERAARRRNPTTGWKMSIETALHLMSTEESLPEAHGYLAAGVQERILKDLATDISPLSDLVDAELAPLLTQSQEVLVTPHLTCTVCADRPALRRKQDSHLVRLLRADGTRSDAILATAHCATCATVFWPDHLSVRLQDDQDEDARRVLRMEPDPVFIRISKSDQLWAHRDIAYMQESSFLNLHCGWSSFANFLNDWRPGQQNVVTYRQVQRLFVEHFARRMLSAHGLLATFECHLDPNTKDLMDAVVRAIGRDGGAAPKAFEHHCEECTHPKRYRPAPGAIAVNVRDDAMVGGDDDDAEGAAAAVCAFLALATEAQTELLSAKSGSDSCPGRPRRSYCDNGSHGRESDSACGACSQYCSLFLLRAADLCYGDM